MTVRKKCPNCKLLENGNLDLCGPCEAEFNKRFEIFGTIKESPPIREYPNVIEKLWQDTYADSISDQLQSHKPISCGAIRKPVDESPSIHSVASEFAGRAVDAFRAKFPEWAEVTNGQA